MESAKLLSSRGSRPTPTRPWPEAYDHRRIPPPLLQQLGPDGIIVIPVGSPGAQHVLKAVKRVSLDGQMSVFRSDIYSGAIIPFVSFATLSSA
jgi:protein-L-isoaspartate O-methyltransferase